jgi:N-acetyl-gamma-glutamyl-phosphate/LysW-gamma-L-alpha-aminoadipyl-6-phosphate reductase
LNVGILGASGFVGGELLRLLIQHPNTTVTIATSRQYERDYVHRIHANLKGFTDLKFTGPDVDQIIKECDFVFTAVPHGSALKVMPALVKSGIKVVDMSADYRLRRAKDYEKWYGYAHPHPDLLEKFILGIPELRREEIRNSNHVSAPGCMAATSILGLAPVIASGLVEERIIIDVVIDTQQRYNKSSRDTLVR